jgi:hypothetical protein
MAVQMHSVSSEGISAVGHDAKTGTIHVTFKSGDTHPFGPFTTWEFAAFKAAPSIGKHFHANIKRKALK